MPLIWWIGMESNHRRAGLQPTALPIELPIRLVERVGVEPTKPIGRLVYSQGFSPVNASPNQGAEGEHQTHSLLFKNSRSAI